jgi:hypothetical protein
MSLLLLQIIVYYLGMKPSIDLMLDTVFAASVNGQRDELVRLAGRERINNDLDVVLFYLAKLAIDGSKLAGEVLRQMLELEQVGVA